MIKKLLNTKISKENKKGFTLAELLIVVAIIGVLVAISIPIFTNQLEKSKEATDMANIRAYYADISTALTTQDLDAGSTGKTLTLATGVTASVTTALSGASGTFTVTVAGAKSSQGVAEWQSGDQEVAGYKILSTNDMKGKTNIAYTFTVTADSATTASTTYLSAIAFS